jgi:hypothetical protein
VKGIDAIVHRRLPVLLAAAVAGTALLAGAPATSAALPRVDAVNLGMASWGESVALEGGRLAFNSGEPDLDGDGDRTDPAAYVWDPATGSTTNLGLAAGILRPLAGGRLAFPVQDYAQGGSGFNGAVDPNQNSVHVWDPAAGRTVDLGIGALQIVPFGVGVGLQVMESQEGKDLNGDGDTDDLVVHVWDPAGGLQNLKVASVTETLTALDGGRLAFLVGESDQDHKDRNGDGSSGDRVLAAWDPLTGTVLNSGLVANRNVLVALEGGAVGFLVSEDDQGHRDRNGDGDEADKVAAVWDPATGATTNLGLAGLASAGHSGSAGDGRLALTVVEADQGGRDLNQDGDADDNVVHVWDPHTGMENLKLAASRYHVNFRAVGSRRLAFLVTEEEHGGRDRNGDGDASDFVVHIWEAGAGTRNLELASLGLVALDSAVVAFRVFEDAQGGTDLNGDGDDDDAALHVWDPATGARNLGISAMGIWALEGGRVAFSVWETHEGGRDRNGNGDTIDELLHVWDPESDTVIDLGFASITGPPESLGAGRLAFLVYEGMQHADLNGDGDRSDHVLHVATLGAPAGPPAATPPVDAPGPGGADPGPTGPAPPGSEPTDTTHPPARGRFGYWIAGADGTVFAFGEAAHHGNAAPAAGGSIVDLEPTPAGAGYWLVDDHGRVSAAGDARSFGSVDPARLAAEERITSLAATRSGQGYWIFTSKGRVLPFGDAVFHGDMAAVALNGPVLDSIVTPSGRGYYMVAADGGIFAFGDAEFFGSMGATPLNAPVQSLVPDPDGAGYWLVASDGGVFAFKAPFLGSLGDIRLNRPVTGMVAYGKGYLMVAEDGGIFNFSDQPFSGSLGAEPPAHPIVSVAALK